MSDSDNKKPRRALKNLPPDRFQPKMLIFWLALVAAVLALLIYSPAMSTTPDTLSVRDVLDRAEAGLIANDPKPVISPDPSGGRDWVTIVGQSKRSESEPNYRPFRAAGRLTDSNMERLQKSKVQFARPP